MNTDVRSQGHGTPSPAGALRMNSLYLGLILITIGLGVAGELLFKTGPCSSRRWTSPLSRLLSAV